MSNERMARGRALYLAVYESQGGRWEANDCKELWCEKADRFFELLGPAATPPSELRHLPRRTMTGGIEIVDRQFDFVRAVLPYDYRFTCNAQQWDEAERICRALEGEMISQGVVSAVSEPAPCFDNTTEVRKCPKCGRDPTLPESCSNVDCPYVYS